MIVVDLNLLLYAINEESPMHTSAKRWWESALNGDEAIGLAWVVILGFIRITTNPRIFPHPLTAEQSLALMNEWLKSEPVRTVQPGPEHWRILQRFLNECGAAGNLTTDAHLATLTIENGGQLQTCDADFGRFTGLVWNNPIR